MESQRLNDLQKFYSIIARLEEGLGGARTLGGCSGRLTWPKRGVYFPLSLRPDAEAELVPRIAVCYEHGPLMIMYV